MLSPRCRSCRNAAATYSPQEVTLEVGGGFNLMAAAARQGLDVAYGGALGHGPFGDLARRALQAEGIAQLLPDAADEQRDTGFDVVLVEASGERTFVTAVGAEAGVTSQRLDHVEIRPYRRSRDLRLRAAARGEPTSHCGAPSPTLTRDHGVLRPRSARSHPSRPSRGGRTPTSRLVELQ